MLDNIRWIPHMAEKAENVHLANLSVTIQVKFEGLLCQYRKSFHNKICFPTHKYGPQNNNLKEYQQKVAKI